MFKSRSARRTGFTLIELLTVIAIIGILIAVLVPAIGMAQVAVKKATSRARFGDWIRAISMYQSTYGYYPNLGTGQSGSADSYYTLDQGSAGENLIRALSGKNADRQDLTEDERKTYNKQSQEFCSFPNECFENDDPQTKKLVDGFGNPKIRIIIDTDRTGDVIMKELPADQSELGLQSGNRLNAKIVIYTLKTDGTGYQDILVKQ